MNAYRAMKLNQGEAVGDANDLRGAHVTMEFRGRTLLGEIVDQQFLRDDVDAEGWYIRVEFFNGEPWPTTEWLAPARVELLAHERAAIDGVPEDGNGTD